MRSDVVSEGELCALTRSHRSLVPSVAAVYALIVACFALLYRFGPPPFGAPELLVAAAVFLAVGWCQYTLVQALHEATHQVLARPGARRTAAMIFLVYANGLTEQYRGRHMAHHAHFGDPERDPDYPGYADFPRSRAAMVRWLLRNASGLPALLEFLRRSGEAERAPRSWAPQRGELLRLIAVQAPIFAVIAGLFGPLHYIVFWVFPIATVAKLLIEARLLCEHGSATHPYVYRTIAGNFWQRNLLGSYGLNYHAEHHLWPSVPYENLSILCKRVRARGGDAGSDVPYETHEGSHLGLLWQWFCELPWTAPHAEVRG